MRTDLPKRLGNRIRELRTRAGLTQAQLADRVDVSHEFMSRLERGLKAPSLATIEKIAKALGIALSEFFDFNAIPRDEKEAMLAGLHSLLAPVSMEKLKLVLEIAKTVMKNG